MPDAGVDIDIEAEDDTEDAFKSAEDRIDRLGDRAERAGSVGFQQLARGAATASNAIQGVYGAMTRLDLTQITLEQSNARLVASREKLNKAVAEFGPQSQQAIEATRDLEAAQSNADKTNLRAHASYVLVSLDLTVMAARAIPAAQSLYGMATAAGAATTAMAALNVATGAIVITATALFAIGFGRHIKQEFTDPGREAAATYNDFADALARAQDEAASQRVAGDDWFSQYAERVSEDLDSILTKVPLVGGALDKVIGTVGEEAESNAQAMEEATAGMAGVVDANLRRVGTSFRDLGIDMRSVSADAVPALLASFGFMGPELDAMVAKLTAAKDAEAALEAQMVALGPAYAAQITFTRQKGETTEDFRQRILAAVGAEHDAEVQIDDTTQSFRLQTDATKEATKAAIDHARPRNFGRERAPDYGVHTVAGGLLGNLGGPLGASLEFGRDMGSLQSLTRVVNRSPSQSSSLTGNRLMNEELQIAISRNPELLQNPQVQRYFQALQRQSARNPVRQSTLGTSQMRSRLLPLITAADGFHGDINQPTMMLVGEAGRERVDVSPGGGRGGQVVNNHVTINVPSENAARQVSRDLPRSLMISNRRFAARRTI